MKLFKFRSFQSRKYMSDILISQRLYCSNYLELNDPFEGMFIVDTGRVRKVLDAEKTIEQIVEAGFWTPVLRDEKITDAVTLEHHYPSYSSTRVCSLSRTVKDVRLWSLYADSHKGCAIEMEIDKKTPGLYPIRYIQNIRDIPSMAHRILRYKTRHWEFEQEHRLITNECFVSVQGKISAIQFGLRTPPEDIEFLRSFAPTDTRIYASVLDPDRVEILRAERHQ